MKKRILIVNNNLNTGGIQKSLVNLLTEISSDFDVTLFLFKNTGDYVSNVPKNVKVMEAKSVLKVLGMSYAQVKKEGLKYVIAKIFFVLMTRLLGNEVSIRTAVRFEHMQNVYDTAISFMHPAPKSEFYGGTNEFVLNRVDALEKIGFVHCDYENYGGDIEYAKVLYSDFNKIAFCSEGCRNSFLKVIPDFASKSEVVYNFHNVDDIVRLASQDPIEYDTTVTNIAIISRLEYAKGIDTAIRAIKEYADRNDNHIRLHIIGDGKDRFDFEELSNQLKLDRVVTFYGNQRNPYRFLKNVDMLLLASHHEAAPMVFGEAQILGIPILATKTTSTDEMIVSSGAGIVCDDSVKDIVTSLDEMILNIKSFRNKRLSSFNEKARLQFYNLLRSGDYERE